MGPSRIIGHGVFRALHESDPGPEPEAGSDRAHGQSLCAQEQMGEGAHRGEGLPTVAPSFLLAGHEPHRGGLLQGEEPHQEGEGEDARSAICGHLWRARSGQRAGRTWLLRGLRLRDVLGPLIMKTALVRLPRPLVTVSPHTSFKIIVRYVKLFPAFPIAPAVYLKRSVINANWSLPTRCSTP